MRLVTPAPFTALVAVLSLAFTLVSGSATAQTIELSPTQQQLNEEAVQAMVDGDFDKAVRQLETAVAIGDANILLLNLGRAYAKAGRCDEASSAYDRAAEAPPVEAPTPSEIAAVLQKYRGELGEQCKTLLIVECTPGNLDVQIGDGPRGPCPAEPVEVEPGSIKVRGFLGQDVVEESIDIKPARENTVALTVDSAPPVEPEPGPSVTWILGWSALGTGLAVLGTSLVIDLAVIGPKLDDMRDAGDAGNVDRYNTLKSDANTLQTVNIALLATGGVLTVAGIVLVLLPDGSDAEASTTGTAFTPWLSPEAAGATWRIQF